MLLKSLIECVVKQTLRMAEELRSLTGSGGACTSRIEVLSMNDLDTPVLLARIISFKFVKHVQQMNLQSCLSLESGLWHRFDLQPTTLCLFR